MSFGFGFTPATVGAFVDMGGSVAPYVNNWIFQHRPGVCFVTSLGGGGGGGGANEIYFMEKPAEAGEAGGYREGMFFNTTLPGTTTQVGSGGTGGQPGTGFNPGINGGNGVRSIINNLFFAPGGSGGRPSVYGSSSPSYNPIPSGNGGFGASKVVGYDSSRGQNGKSGRITVRRVS